LAGAADALDSGLGGEHQLLVTEHLEIFGVEGDSVVLLVLEAEDLGGDVFDCEEEFAVAGEEEGDVGAGELNADFRGWPLQARMLNFRFRRPGEVRVWRKSATFFFFASGSSMGLVQYTE
jgi:hypothetical protein